MFRHDAAAFQDIVYISLIHCLSHIGQETIEFVIVKFCDNVESGLKDMLHVVLQKRWAAQAARLMLANRFD